MLPSQIRLIGVDCATDSTKVGIAAGLYTDGRVQVTDVQLCTKETSAASLAAQWLTGTPRAVIGIDAPLGWPEPLAKSLAGHGAGDHIKTAAHDLFRRETDREVYRTTGKMPLDVGADRIARTAHAALTMLHEIRRQTGKPIPLTWSPVVEDVVAIEVYPAASLSTHGFPSRTYKKVDQRATREAIVSSLNSVLELPPDRTTMLNSADALDAVVCLLAIKDFLDGTALKPVNLDRARREGWIWVRAPR